MKKILYIFLVALLALSVVTSAYADDAKPTESEESNTTLAYEISDSDANVTSPRTGRMVKYPRQPAFTLRRRQPVKIRSRADHYPIRSQIRRVQNGVAPQNPGLRYGYDSLKSSKYNLPSKGAYGNGGKGSSLRQQLLGVHPNGVHVPALSQQYVQNFKASPAYNGKVIVYPVTGNQQQSNQQKQIQQDTNYPKYIKPPPPQQKSQSQSQSQSHHAHHQQQQQQQQLGQPQQPSVAVGQQHVPTLQYPDLKQFPIPDEQQMQKYNEQHEKYLQQQKYLTNRDPMAYYQQQQQQQQQQLQQPAQQQYQSQQPYHHQQYQNYAAVQQPQYVAPKPVLHAQQHPPSIPIHQVASDASQSASLLYGSTSVPPPKMYSVYEENDMTELQNNNYQTAGYESLEKEAQEYLRFMNTNEYFLPKRDPNYKQQDEEHDRQQLQYNLRQQQSTEKTSTQSPNAYTQGQLYAQQSNDYGYQNFYSQQTNNNNYAKQQQKKQQTSPQLFNPHQSDSQAASSYKQSVKGPQLFYQENTNSPSASNAGATQHGSQSSTVVRTSYQTGYNSNQIVVSSQDHKTSKYLGAGQNSLVISTQSPVVSVNNIYSQVRQSPLQQQQQQQQQQKSRTPEPLRFEFTERDAMIGGHAFTYAPTTGHLRYKAVEPPVTPKIPTVLSTTPSTTLAALSTTLRTSSYQHSSNKANGVKSPVQDGEDDPEDEDDMQQAGTNLYGRQPLTGSNGSSSKQQSSTHLVSTTESPPSMSASSSSSSSSSAVVPNNQKDSEEYCERICAIVEDEHEEIVCGSDGYMYTSEAQMECYASCLHIDVTIQGKGSCSAR